MRHGEFPLFRIGLLCTALVCLSCDVLFAQNPYGRITGRIIDSGAAVVPDASVHGVNIGTKVETDVNSAQGNYDARNLIPGLYNLTVERSGFKRYARGPIEVRVGDVLWSRAGDWRITGIIVSSVRETEFVGGDAARVYLYPLRPVIAGCSIQRVFRGRMVIYANFIAAFTAE
jgi:hypothetical protein